MDEFEPVMSFYGYPDRKNCMLADAQCNGIGCRECGFYKTEIARRKKLPLVKLDTGLYGKKVGRRRQPED